MRKHPEASLIALTAAVMAVSNFGYAININHVRWTLDCRDMPDSAGCLVCEFAGHLTENEDHEGVFMAEADSWVSTVKEKGLANMHLTWPRHKEWLDLIVERIA